MMDFPILTPTEAFLYGLGPATLAAALWILLLCGVAWLCGRVPRLMDRLIELVTR